eukprot:552268_1
MSEEKHLPLSKRFSADLGAALVAGFAVSWLITPMDAAVTANMSGKCSIIRSLGQSFKEIGTRPHRYLRRPEFGIVFGVFSMTYLAKNGTDSYCAFKHMSNERTSFIKFWTVFAVNGSLCVLWRDPQFAKIFGTKIPSAVPAISYFCWVSRDVFHALGAVVAPDYVEKKYSLTHEQWRYCQMSFPLLIQVATTPCHLLGLDFYNIKESTLGARVLRTAKASVPTFAIRCVRMFHHGL